MVYDIMFMNPYATSAEFPRWKGKVLQWASTISAEATQVLVFRFYTMRCRDILMLSPTFL
ncbi:hypothetical protein AD951_07510 [Acetobacter malorum]|uniref:Uncharacterized protein n=1 Tax=Acetobacter malorum TaxID=178901 RepID=A0A149UN17_9PROT|nr:hypothetical protein AD951_07510 [Acetobacter malorum]